jgi:hypothetical protein
MSSSRPLPSQHTFDAVLKRKIKEISRQINAQFINDPLTAFISKDTAKASTMTAKEAIDRLGVQLIHQSYGYDYMMGRR